MAPSATSIPQGKPEATPLQHFGRRLLGHSALYGVGTALTLVFALLQLALLTRVFPVADFGRLALLIFFMGLVTALCNLGVVQGTLASVFAGGGDDEDGGDPEEEETRGARPGDNRRVLGTGFLITVVVATSTTLVCAAVAPLLARALLGDSEQAEAIIWATAAGGLGSLWRLVHSIPRFERRPGAFLGLAFLEHALVLGGAVGLAASGRGLAGAMAGFAAGRVVAVAVGLLVSRHRFRPAASRSAALAIVRRGSPFIVISIGFFVSRNFDLYLLSRYVPAPDLALYRVGGRFGTLPSYALSATLFAWGPLLRGPLRVALQQRRAIDRARTLLISYYTFAAVATLVVITLFADALVRIAPGEYAKAAILIPLLGVAAAFHGGLIIVYRMARVPRKARKLARVAVLCMVVTLGAGLVLIPPYGTIGAAVASAISPAVGALVLLVISQRGDEPIPLEWRRMAGAVLVGAGLVAVSFATRAFGPWAEFGARCTLAAAFPLLLIALRILPWAEVRRLGSLMRRPERRRTRRSRFQQGLAGLDADSLEIVHALGVARTPVQSLADSLGRPEDAVLEQYVGALREVGTLGPPSRLDGRIGGYLVSRESVTARDRQGHSISLRRGIDPMELDRLTIVQRELRGVAAARWTALRSASDPHEIGADDLSQHTLPL